MTSAWLQGLRLAVRRLRREPLFALVTVLTLALGIGANIAVFGFVNAYLLAPLPVSEPETVIRVYGRTTQFPYDTMSYPTYQDIAAGTANLDLAAFGFARVLVGATDALEGRGAELVSGNFFRALRLMPVAGRLLQPADAVTEGSGAVVVLSERLWRSRYASDPAIVGRSILLNGVPFEVVGIVPASFHGADSASTVEMWSPITMQQTLRPRGRSLSLRGWGWLRTIGRIDAGGTRETVDAGLARVAADLNRRFPAPGAEIKFAAVPASVLDPADRDAFLPILRLIAAFTILLLTVTCANLAGVMQARVVRGQRDVAVRYSLGAGRSRLLIESLAESLVLAVAGGFAGTLVARVAVAGIAAAKPPAALAGNLDVAAPFDWRVLLFAAGASVVAGMLFGFVPALRASAAPLSSTLKEEGGGSSAGRRSSRLRKASVLIQVAASAVLLVVGALLASSLRHMQAFNPGFKTDGLALMSVDLDRLHVPKADADAFRTAALDAVRSVPGVESASIAGAVPLMPGHDRLGFTIPGFNPGNGRTSLSIDRNIVGATYFETMQMPFVRGGAWDARDIAPRLVVNETAAKRYWPGRDAVGQTIMVVDKPPIALTVAGVVRDSAYYQVGETPVPFVFLPAEFAKPTTYTFVTRLAREDAASDAIPAIARAISSANSRVKPFDATTFEAARQIPLYPQKMLAASSAIFGSLALILTGVGLYGVVSTTVGQRTREIGVRMALGARSGDVQRGILGDAAILVAVGGIAGLAGGYALTGALKSWLYGVTGFDLGIYAGVLAMLGALAIAAAWVPARRAARVDPVVALRN